MARRRSHRDRKRRRQKWSAPKRLPYSLWAKGEGHEFMREDRISDALETDSMTRIIDNITFDPPR